MPWAAAAARDRPRAVLSRVLVAMSAGGMSARDRESAVENALGQGVVSQRAVRALTDCLTHASEAFRTRDRSGDDSAYRLLETVYMCRMRPA